MKNAVIGPLTQTKWPCLHLVREQDIVELVKYISSMPATNKNEDFGDSYYEEQIKKKQGAEYKTALDAFVKSTKSSSRSIILAEMISDFNLFVYVKDFVKSYQDFITEPTVADEFEIDVNSWFAKYLGGFSLESVSNVTHTSPAPIRAKNVSILWKVGSDDLHNRPDRRKLIEDGSISFLKKIVEKYSTIAPKLISDDVLGNLLSEIGYLPNKLTIHPDTKEIGTSIYQTYSAGKQEKQRLCNLCGFAGTDDAAAGLIGEGSEKFTNFLPGGMKLGAGRKAMVCPLCLLEATLRGFYFPSSPHGTLFIFPDMSLSPTVFKIWSDTVNEFIRLENLGLGLGKSWNMLEVYKTLANGKINETAQLVTKQLRLTNNELKQMAQYLEEKRDSPEEVEYDVLQNTTFEKSYEGLVKAHLHKIIKIDNYLMEDYLPKSTDQSTSLITPSYAISFLRDPLRDSKDEAPSTSALRTYLLTTILSDVFHARVQFVEGYQPIENIGFPGRINVQLPAPAENALRSLGSPATIRIHQISDVLRIMSSIVLVSMSYVKALGKDRLLRLASMNRGAILRRAQMEAKTNAEWDKSKYGILELLDNLPAKAGDLESS
jgi:hypothetical protein